MYGGGGYKGLSLNAAAATGAGDIIDLYVPRSVHTMQVTITGGPTAVIVALEGSLDRTNFRVMTSWDLAAPLVSGDMVTASVFAGTGIRAYPAVPYVRANLTTLTGGTAPTVTALIAGV
jgi:hypothetical protein